MRVYIYMYTDDDIFGFYVDKLSIKEIVKKTGRSLSYVYAILNKKGVNFNAKCKKNRNLEESVKLQIISLYQQGLGYRKIEQLLPDIGKRAIFKCLRNAEIKIDKYTYSYNDALFDEPNRGNMQLFGYIFADGNLSSRGKYSSNLSFCLSEKDYNYLLYIKDNLFKTQVPITKRINKPSCFPNGKMYVSKPTYSMDIHSKPIVQKCVSLGLHPRKSYSNFGIPISIPSHLLSSFVLGFFEGDGCLSFDKNIQNYRWSIVGQEHIINDFKNVIFDQLHIESSITKYPKIKEEHQQLYSIGITRRENLIKLYHWLYKNAAFVMQRKYDKWVTLMRGFEAKGYNVGEIYKFENCERIE